MADPKQAKCLTDPNWRYVPAEETDIRKRFNRIRRQLKEAESAKHTDTHVVPMRRSK